MVLEHSKKHVSSLIKRRNLDSESLVVELASNDGYLLQFFQRENIPVLGIEPAEGPADAAEKRGVPTLRAFFGEKLAQQLVGQGKRADVLIGNNVLAHIPEVRGFLAGVRHFHKDDGIAVFEVPYVRDLVDVREFDTIYHEHVFYFSLSALVRLFGSQRLYLQQVTRIPIHGGSLRVTVSKTENPETSVLSLLEDESSLGLTTSHRRRPPHFE